MGLYELGVSKMHETRLFPLQLKAYFFLSAMNIQMINLNSQWKALTLRGKPRTYELRRVLPRNVSKALPKLVPSNILCCAFQSLY